MKVVVLVPHPDDETLGFGGVIQKHKSLNHCITVLFAERINETNVRYKLQAAAAKHSSEILGFDFKFLDISSDDLLECKDSCIDFVETTIADILPDVLYIPHGADTHQDHQALFKVARIATRMYGKAPIKRIMCGEIISSTDCSISLNPPFSPNTYETLSEHQVQQKQNALASYWNETKQYPHPRSIEGIKVFAQKRGMECGTKFAEAFQCLRNII